MVRSDHTVLRSVLLLLEASMASTEPWIGASEDDVPVATRATHLPSLSFPGAVALKAYGTAFAHLELAPVERGARARHCAWHVRANG